jgi:hypothetical protein
MSNVFGECHTSFSIKTPFVDFEKGMVQYSRNKRLN